MLGPEHSPHGCARVDQESVTTLCMGATFRYAARGWRYLAAAPGAPFTLVVYPCSTDNRRTRYRVYLVLAVPSRASIEPPGDVVISLGVHRTNEQTPREHKTTKKNQTNKEAKSKVGKLERNGRQVGCLLFFPRKKVRRHQSLTHSLARRTTSPSKCRNRRGRHKIDKKNGGKKRSGQEANAEDALHPVPKIIQSKNAPRITARTKQNKTRARDALFVLQRCVPYAKHGHQKGNTNNHTRAHPIGFIRLYQAKAPPGGGVRDATTA